MAEDIRHGRYWLLAAQIAAILPQWDHLPLWLVLAVVGTCLWRTPRVEVSLPPPGFMGRVLLMGLGIAGLWHSYSTLIGPEAGTAFLILCMAAKLLEMRNRRDCHVVVILGFFVAATNFLFGQSLGQTLYIGLVLVLIVGSLLVMHQPADRNAAQTGRQALVLVGQAFPLMLILFVFFPRLPPLWTMHLNKTDNQTGMSDTVSPGDIAHLSQSDALAFRVEFAGAVPDKSTMYWRGLALSRFDGESWRQAAELSSGDLIMWPGSNRVPNWIYGLRVDRSNSVNYKVTLEPTGQTWLFALVMPYSETEGVGLTREMNLQADQPVTVRRTYDVRSFKPVQLDTQLSDMLRYDYLKLPDTGNPRSQAIARQWRQTQGSDAAYINFVMNWFHQQNFVYTLSPPALDGDRVDEFLFNTRQGFCEHYASAFVFLMRAAGLPARMVVGYQGGQAGPRGDYWEVRQMDAHAWTEVWLPEKGWVQFDPTAMVAPERIRLGASAMVEKPAFWGDSGASVFRYNNFRLFRGVHEWLDDLNFRWTRSVIGYNSDKQDGLMTRLLGNSDYVKRTLVMAGLFTGTLGLVIFWWWWRQPRLREPAADRYYRNYCRRMAAAGLPREPGEGVADYAARVAQARPRLAASTNEIRLLYTRLRYQPAGAEQQELLKRLRRHTLTAPVKP
jgi:transglutaminase-like putative cysteine protease